MRTEKSFIGGFLVLGFAIFIVGFLTGMLAIALIPANPETTTLGFMAFILGFITGMVVIALTLVVVQLSRLTKTS